MWFGCTIFFSEVQMFEHDRTGAALRSVTKYSANEQSNSARTSRLAGVTGNPGGFLTTVNAATHGLRRAVDRHGFVLGLLLQKHRDSEAAKNFMM